MFQYSTCIPVLFIMYVCFCCRDSVSLARFRHSCSSCSLALASFWSDDRYSVQAACAPCNRRIKSRVTGIFSTSCYLFMTSLTVRSVEIACCFMLTRVSSTMCLLRKNPLSASACQWLIHNAALTTSIRLMYFGLPRPSFCLATCDQYSSTDATWPSADSIHSGDISASA